MRWSLLLRGAARAHALPLARGWLAVAFAALSIALPAQAQAQAQDDFAMATAEIMDSIQVSNQASMDFGINAPQGTNGTVVMTPAASATCTPTGGIIRTPTAVCRAARFSGITSYRFRLLVTMPVGDQITLTGPSGATMRVDNFTTGGGPGVQALGGPADKPARFRIDNQDGSFILYVGGRLNVAGNQRPGVYTGSFTISFNYN